MSIMYLENLGTMEVELGDETVEGMGRFVGHEVLKLTLAEGP